MHGSRTNELYSLCIFFTGTGVVFSELCEAHRSNPRRAMTQLQSSGEATGVSAMGQLDVAPAPSPMVSPEV